MSDSEHEGGPAALVGHTGFVGGNLLRQRPFDELYNSANVDEMAGRRFGTMVCAAAPGEKWRANQDPAADRERLARLTSALRRARAERLVLISTVDVYPDPRRVDETTPMQPDRLAPYGLHRLQLEQFACEHFPTLVVRLPGIFGPGLRKNVIYDLLHDHRVAMIDPRAEFQFYDLGNLWRDIQRALAAGLTLVNFATEPVIVRDIARDVFGRELAERTDGQPPHYDVRTVHAALFGGRDGYLSGRREVLDALRAFVRKSSATGA